MPTAAAPTASSSIIYTRPAGRDRVWNVNPDNDSVSVFDAVTGTRLAEIPVGRSPRTLAAAPDGTIWVLNKRSDSISVVDGGTLAVTSTVSLPAASQPHGLVFTPDGSSAYVSLEALGQVMALDATGAETARIDVGPTPRHLSVSADGATLLVSRFITPALPGEHTETPVTRTGDVFHGGEVVRVDTAGATAIDTVVLRTSDRQDSEHAGRGVPNYLAAAVFAPDGASVWVPSKQDNIQRGILRDGRALQPRQHGAQHHLAHRPGHGRGGLPRAHRSRRRGDAEQRRLRTLRQLPVRDAGRQPPRGGRGALRR